MISRATIYNTLNLFVEQGLLRELHLAPDSCSSMRTRIVITTSSMKTLAGSTMFPGIRSK